MLTACGTVIQPTQLVIPNLGQELPILENKVQGHAVDRELSEKDIHVIRDGKVSPTETINPVLHVLIGGREASSAAAGQQGTDWHNILGSGT
jgi:hypothetical protein